MTEPHTASPARVLRLLRTDAQAGKARRDALWAIARAGGAVTRPSILDGFIHRATEADRTHPEGPWTAIARQHGVHPTTLQAFNHKKRSDGAPKPWTAPRLPRVHAGTKVYIPSADEVLFAQCVDHMGGHVAVATRLYHQLCTRHHRRLLRAGRTRATGRLGLGYANDGLEGVFLSPNPALAGASDAPGRWESIGGRREYRVQWAASFWKCSVYLQDVVHHAGYEAHVTDHAHYLVAGQVHRSPLFAAHPVAQASPGDVWQRWGGDGVEDSHTGVLASFVAIRPLEGETLDGKPLDVWTFRLLGAEEAGAAESIRDQIMIRGTDRSVEGRHLRFFSPTRQRGGQDVGSVSH